MMYFFECFKLAILLIRIIVFPKFGSSGYFTLCPQINSSYPKFSEPINTDVEMVDGKYESLNCCIFGVPKILWFFKPKYYNQPWKLKTQTLRVNGFYILSDSNRSLLFLQPKTYEDSGIYKCVGTNHSNNLISAEISLYVGNGQKEFKIIGYSDPTKMYRVNSEHTIFCSVKAHKKSFCIFTWNRVIENQNRSIIASSNLTTDRTNDTLTNGYSGYASLSWMSLEKNHRIYNFTLNLKSLNESQEGYYSCHITESSANSELLHLFHFRLYRRNMIFLVIELIVSFIVILAILRAFQYDIKIIIFQIIRKFIKQKNISNNYNFLFLYNFECENEFQVIDRIVKELENRGFSSYFYHRDKIYGRDTIEDITQKLKNADLIVIWASENMWENSTCNFCMQIILNRFCNIKRIYIMTSRTKLVLKTCESKQVLIDTKSCLSSKRFRCNLDVISKDQDRTNYSETWYWHYFLSWLISSLPLESVCKDNTL